MRYQLATPRLDERHAWLRRTGRGDGRHPELDTSLEHRLARANTLPCRHFDGKHPLLVTAASASVTAAFSELGEISQDRIDV